MESAASKANERQVGGNHYKKQGLQHWDFCIARDGPAYLEQMIVKYVSRWKDKAGVQDLQKAGHFLEKLVEWGITNPEDVSTPSDNRKLDAFLDGLQPLGEAEELIIRKVATWRDGAIQPLFLHQAYIALQSLIDHNIVQDNSREVP